MSHYDYNPRRTSDGMATPPWVGKGGSGKSTLATNLAVMARRSELKSAPQGSSFVG